MKVIRLIILIILVANAVTAEAQIGENMGDESRFYASTKQVNQFFRRFNSEEDEEGNRIYQGARKFHDPKQRRRYIELLFDNETSSYDAALKKIFIDEVTDPQSPVLLDFHGGKWVAEVHARFRYQGKEATAILFMNLQEEEVGSKWVIEKAHFPPFKTWFMDEEKKDNAKFLHPLSHELDFMNLNKIFQNKDEVGLYTSKEFKPDHLTLMLSEIQKGNMTFVTIRNVKFHFFQIENWYFELAEFNREGYNTGWLISNLSKLTEEQKESYKKYIYFENQ